jgi:hypothetical protein
MFDISQYEVGDEFEGSPNELSRFISAILAEEGSFSYEGTSVIIESLPKRKPVENKSYVKEAAKDITNIVEEEAVYEPITEYVEPVKKETEAKSPGRPRKTLAKDDISDKKNS